MFNSKLLFIACSVIATHAALGYSDLQDPVGGSPVAQSDTVKGNLKVLVQNYLADPSAPLNDQGISDLGFYANNSIGKGYDSLNKMDRMALAQMLNLHPDLFSASMIDKFNTDQKLLARMTTQDNKALASIIVDIRDGKELSPMQVSDVKDFETMISKNPQAFIVDLPYLTQYVRLNPDKFSFADQDTFSQASRDASGINADQSKLLTEIASRNNKVLNREDISVLQDLARKAPIGALNGLDPQVAIALHQTIADNSNNFPSSAVTEFNRAYNKNQAIQLYLAPVPAGRANAKSVIPQRRVEAPVSPRVKQAGAPTSAGQR